ncbi:hypothetical protein Pcinc_007337 [Petrolisthes cinctipes]|uniref:Uncharacterized protein n=1 Tax=Petrolisthes cinctipes TaxID=88211 RepID=A0AAE1GB08_PETCI|nr:hypothetical protein Pcinc_007337 [Petrolisthes cinctipes]
MSQGNSPTPIAQTHHTPLTTQGIEPSLRFPTRDYLQKPFNKPDHQKWCRELGLTKVWVTKDELIKIILQKCQSKPRAPDEEDPAPPPGGIRPAPTSLGHSWQIPPSSGDPETVPTPFGNSPSTSRPPNDPETATTLSGLLPSGWCEITLTPSNVSESPSPPTDNPETDPTPSDDS